MTVVGTRHVLRSLREQGVDFLLVGSLAVNVDGLLRMTLDVDLVVKLDRDNLQRAFDALASAGHRPTLPVTAADLGDPQVRSHLVRERNLQVLRYHSEQYPETPVDVFAGQPFVYAEERARAVVRQLEGIGEVRVVSLRTLISMKEAAGRPQDLADAARLRRRGAAAA
jgi:predicted nucleotidyltransferase